MILWETPVLDRSQADVDYAKTLWDIGYNNLTDTQKAEYIAGLKGSLNLSDLYRLQNNIQLLSNVLELGLDLRIGKNILDVTANSTTISGVSFIVNPDKSITIKGKNISSDTTFYNFNYSQLIPNDVLGNSYHVNAQFETNVFNVRYGYFKNDGSYYNGANLGDIFFPNNASKFRCFISVPPNVSVNTTVYPMIYPLGPINTYYEPYDSSINVFYPKEKVFTDIIEYTEIIRNAYTKYDTTPSTPLFPLNDYTKFNDIEQILTDVYKILNSNFHYYTGQKLYSGRRIGLL